jgi:hypothetical protein
MHSIAGLRNRASLKPAKLDEIITQPLLKPRRSHIKPEVEQPLKPAKPPLMGGVSRFRSRKIRRRFEERFSVGRMARDYLALYNAVLRPALRVRS